MLGILYPARFLGTAVGYHYNRRASSLLGQPTLRHATMMPS